MAKLLLLFTAGIAILCFLVIVAALIAGGPNQKDGLTGAGSFGMSMVAICGIALVFKGMSNAHIC